jgi:hypothetical protein
MMTAAQVSSTDDSALAEHLIAVAREMDADDRESLLTVLGVIVSALHPPRAPDDTASASVRAALRVLRDLRHPPGAANNGVLFRGRPDWFSDRMLNDLRAEAATQRAVARRSGRHWYARGGPRASELELSAELNEFVSSFAGPVKPTLRSNINFYEEAGDAVEPHFDRSEFGLNALFVVRHEHLGAARSSLYLYPADAPPERFDLVPGEVLLFYAGSVVHERTAVGPDEYLASCSFGYIPGT